MKPLLVLRPRPGADATVRRAERLGLKAIAAPLFEIVPIDWRAPDPADFDAILMTSANAARQSGAAVAAFRNLPLFAVGAATADAARTLGFADVEAGQGNGDAALELAAAKGIRRLLHLAGRERANVGHPAIRIERRIVYAAEPATVLPAAARSALDEGAVALLHSARAATLFHTLLEKQGVDRSDIALAALSGAILDAAGSGWAEAVAAFAPNDDALLAIAARLCDQDLDCRSGAGGGEDRT